MAVDQYIGIQMNQKELIETVMMILNWKKNHFGFQGFIEENKRFKG